jgi:preprotein translocase subunit YajC
MITSILDFFIDTAQAAPPAAAPPAQGSLSMLVVMLVFIGFMYLTVWRPQSKRAKEHRALLNALTLGDEIVTAGGILGKINKVADLYVVITVADNVNITVQKSSIATVLPKGTLKSV